MVMVGIVVVIMVIMITELCMIVVAPVESGLRAPLLVLE